METETAPPKSSRKTALLVLLGLLLILLVAAAFWYFFLRGPVEKSKQTTEKTATTSTKTATTSPQIVNTLDDETLIKKALVAKTGIAEDKIDVTVSQKSGNFAKGLVGAKGEIGGGYFLAFKDKGNWIIVFDGQSTPECSLINPIAFPASMVPECLDAAGNPVQR